MIFSRHLPVVVSVYQCKYAAPSLEVTHPLPQVVLPRALPHGRATAPVAVFRPFFDISSESRRRANAARLQEIDARRREIASRQSGIDARKHAKPTRRTAKAAHDREYATRFK